MLQNITDTRYSALQTLKVTFNESYQYAIVWKNGEKSVVRLENNEYVVKLDAGEAVYVIPFNPDESNGEDGFHDAASGDNGGWWPGSTSGTSQYETTMIDTVHEAESGDNGAWYPGSANGKSPW